MRQDKLDQKHVLVCHKKEFAWARVSMWHFAWLYDCVNRVKYEWDPMVNGRKKALLAN